MIFLVIILIVLYQFIYQKLINKFVLNNKALVVIGIISIIVSTLLFLYIKNISFLLFIGIILCFTGLIDLSVTDFKYYEIDPKAYYFILVPVLIIAGCNYLRIWENLISFGLVFIVFELIDKLFGIEKLGGADVKLLLILSIGIPYYNVFMFLFFSFVINYILYLVRFIINKLQKEPVKNVSVPMIIAITLGWTIIMSLF
jgi:Flp pilus assembly protein protease CpaA